MAAQLDEALLKATSDLPSNLQQKLHSGLRKWQSKKHKSLSVLITGKTGAGKSTLTNALLGLNVNEDQRAAREGSSIKSRCTTVLEKYKKDKDGINVAVWDTPGLQDGTEYQDDYIQQMKQQCTEVELMMYCVKMSETRFVRGNENPDVVAMKKLTVAFEPDFWQKAIIVLTYANTLEAFNIDWVGLPDKEKAEAFNSKLREWEEQIKKILIEDIHIPKDIVEDVVVVPAGHARHPHLPGQEYWLSNLWFQCLYTMTSPEAQCALLQMNLTRFKSEQDVQKDDFKRPAEFQPIVFAERILKDILPEDTLDAVLGAAAVGASVGTLAGPTGSVVGAIGAGAIALAVAYSGEIGKAWKKMNKLKNWF